MSCKEGNLINCIKECETCGNPTNQTLTDRNMNCQSVCGGTLNHGYASYKPICHCCPRTHIIPCDVGTDYERKKCYLEQGYQYFEDECVTSPDGLKCEDAAMNTNRGYFAEYFNPPLNPQQENQFNVKKTTQGKTLTAADIETDPLITYNRSVGGGLHGPVLGGLHINNEEYIGCDFTFPYNNNIKLLQPTPWIGNVHKNYKMQNGGYLKYDKLTNNIVLVSMNPRQGNDEIANVGIMKTPAIDPKFKPEPISTNTLSTSINKSVEDLSQYSQDDLLLESKLENNVVNISKNNLNLVFDFFTCQYGTLRIKDKGFQKGVHKYYVFGLGPITTNTETNFSLNWADYKRRCNQGFGTMQGFGIYGSHWPVMYVLRLDQNTGEQKCYMVYFDHYRKTEYFFDTLQDNGIIKIRTREPEFRFYVSIEDSILNLRKQFMKISGPPQPPVQKAMGLWVQKFGYENWLDLERDITIVRSENFPVDGFIFDFYWYGHKFPEDVPIPLNTNSYSMNFCHQRKDYTTANELGKFIWDEENFPNHVSFLNNLMKKYNYGNTLMQEPYITADAEDFSYMFTNDMVARLENGSWAEPEGVWNNWIGRHAALPDFTNPELSKYWFTTRIVPNMTDGTFFWWNDLSEPEASNENAFYLGVGQVTKDNVMLHEMKQSPDILSFNQFLWVQGICQEYNKQLNKRYNVLCRAGTCGIQRYGAFMWPGDSFPKLVQLNASTNSLANLALSGLDFSASDAGGFAAQIGEDERQKLYSMWYANSAATNFTLKPHKYAHPDQSSAAPTEWGSVEDNLFNTVERYMLSPYYYSSAMDISSLGTNQGSPFTTTLFFKYQFDNMLLKEALDQKKNSLTQFVGPNLVYAMLYKYEEISRSIYFPKDTKWYDYRNNKWFDGGSNYVVKFKSKNICPLFIKNNSIVPMRSKDQKIIDMRYNDILTSYDVYIYSYFGKDADVFTLYIDDGISMNRNQTKIKLSYKNGVAHINIPSIKSFNIPNFNFFLVDNNGMTRLGPNSIIRSIYEAATTPIDSNCLNIIEGFGETPSDNKITCIIMIILAAVIAYFIGKSTCKDKSNVSKFILVGIILGMCLAIMLAIKN
jgi:alpha-glucosidase (family GH31 glycosyl hydrolase)